MKTKSNFQQQSGKRKPVIPNQESASPGRSQIRSKPAEDIVLLAVTGLTPSILTETIWALAHPDAGREPVIPSRVIVVTTTDGRDKIGKLFKPTPTLGGVSPWAALRSSLENEGHDLSGRLRFGQTADDVRVITACDRLKGCSVELADIRNRADNEATADFFLEIVRGIVENPDTQLIVSIAGGRKTMGALLYACMTLAGRETDRLTHVLVSKPFETLREYYFPGQPGDKIRGQDEVLYEPAQACVELADVPFVALRNLFQRELGRKAGTFSRLVETCRENVRRQAMKTMHLSIHFGRPRMEVNGEEIKFAPLEHLLLLFLAQRAKDGKSAYASYDDAVDDLNLFRENLIAKAPKNDLSDWRNTDNLHRSLWDEEDIRKTNSRIRAKLSDRGGVFLALANYLPVKGRCSLDIAAKSITIK